VCERSTTPVQSAVSEDRAETTKCFDFGGNRTEELELVDFPRWISLIFRASRDIGILGEVTVPTGRDFVVIWGRVYRYRERRGRQM